MATTALLADLPIIDRNNKSEIIKECSAVEDQALLRDALYRIAMQVVVGDAPSDLIVSALHEIIKQNQHVVNILCDVLSVLDIESKILEREYRDNFLTLITHANNRIVADWLLKERLDYETIGDARIISNSKQAQTKYIKLKTKLYYKQQKFNLFREESEGYSKLLTELCQDGKFDPSYMLNSIKSLIGCFNLDPNRVLDIILECFEARLYLKDSFIPLIKNFLDNPSTLNQILAFKFNFYNAPDNELEIPSALYDVTASVISNNLIRVDDIYPYLLPTDAKIVEAYKAEIEEAKKFHRKLSEIMAVEGAKHEDVDIFEEERTKAIGPNQKLGLVLALLRNGDWRNASNIMGRLPEYCTVAYPAIGAALCELISYQIDPLYRRCSELPASLASRLKPLALDWPLLPSMARQVDAYEAFKAEVLPAVLALGPYLFRSTLLMTKLLRLYRSLVRGADAETYRYDALNLLNAVVLPAFGLVEANPAMAEELWSLLRLFPYNERFALYHAWKGEPAAPLLIRMKCYGMRRLRYIMKRISKDKESIKQSGRVIGKLSHSNPTYLFEYILGQIQSYDNLIGPVVDSLKYLSSVSYDVLLFCVIEVLSNPAKEASKHEGTSISPWLISLANFCGAVVKKYPVELPGLLQFITNQLKVNKCLDLLILKEIVQKMTGIDTTEEMTDEQLEALSGGELLKSEGGTFNQVRNIKKSTVRLKDALLENGLAMALCILMAQQRNCIVFQQSTGEVGGGGGGRNTHLKLVGKLYDQCQETLVQYGHFLSYSLSIEDYRRRLPPVRDLFVDFHLSPDVTFFLVRPMVNHDINSIYEEFLSGKADKTKSFATECYARASDAVLNPLVEAIIPIMGSLSVDLNPRFFVTFWTLTMYDLKVPAKSYARERGKITAQMVALEESKELAASKRRKEKERLLGLTARLMAEEAAQGEHTERVLHRLDGEKGGWFETTVNKMDVTTHFLQYCLFPRCKWSASDALFCAKFVHLLHCLKTPNFSTLICFDRIFGDISYTMSSCTENEANHYGRFLCSILDIAMRWHRDTAVFAAECAKFPGFVTKFCEKDPVHIDYESYRHVCHKWHYRLTKAFILCLDSGDYIQIRNSLIILSKLLVFFPVMISFAQAIERRLDNIRNSEREKRPDLFVLATGYSGQLKLKKGSFIPESEFHEKETKKVTVAAATTAAVAAASAAPSASSATNAASSGTLAAQSVSSEHHQQQQQKSSSSYSSSAPEPTEAAERRSGGHHSSDGGHHKSSENNNNNNNNHSSEQSRSSKAKNSSSSSSKSTHVRSSEISDPNELLKQKTVKEVRSSAEYKSSTEGGGGGKSSDNYKSSKSSKSLEDGGGSSSNNISSSGSSGKSQISSTISSSSNSSKELSSAMRAESRASSSASSSPKRSSVVADYRSKESASVVDIDSGEKEYKKRKIESKAVDESSSGSNERQQRQHHSSQAESHLPPPSSSSGGGRSSTIATSSSSSGYGDKKTSLRKRTAKETSSSVQEAPEPPTMSSSSSSSKRKKEHHEESSSSGSSKPKRGDDRSSSDARKSDNKRSTSRRYKQDDDK